MLRLLQGFSLAPIREAMASSGFTAADLDEGWRLLREASSARIGPIPAVASAPRHLAIDAWEERWLPVVDATLKRHAPESHDTVMRGVSKWSGPTVILGVGLLLDRLDELRADEKEESREAVAMLERRGVNAAVLDEARALLTALRRPLTGRVVTDADRKREGDSARAMWAWYGEWSTIARTLIKDGRHLVTLGFIRVGRPRKKVSA